MRMTLLFVALFALVGGVCLAARADDDAQQMGIEDFREELLRNRSIRSADGQFTLYVNDIRGRRLMEPVLLMCDGNGMPTGVTRAKEGKLLFDEPHGKVYVELKEARTLTSGGEAYAENRVYPLVLSMFKLSPRPAAKQDGRRP